MAAEGEGFRDQVVLVARHLHAKAIGFDWRRIGELLLVEGWNEARADTLRFALARSYYGAMARLDRAQTSA